MNSTQVFKRLTEEEVATGNAQGAIASERVTYPVVETFHSIQGEGRWSGCSAFFIRLAGCDVGCPWCDTKASWPLARHPRITVGELTAQVCQAKPQMVVITGGEPLLHDLTPLTTALRSTGYPLHLETSGAHPLTGQFDWITWSPKRFKSAIATIYPHVQELKVVIQTAEDLVWAEAQASKVTSSVEKFLQPEWGTPSSAVLVWDYILTHPQWRMSLQTHKFLGVR